MTSSYPAYIANVEAALNALLDDVRAELDLLPSPAPVVGLTSEEAS